MRYLVILSIMLSFSFKDADKLSVGKKVPKVELSGNDGSFFNSGIAWNTTMLEGNKPSLLMYVDPDKEKEVNNIQSAILKNQLGIKIQVFVIVNIKSTWKPKFAVEKRLKERLKENKLIKFVIDNRKIVQNEWVLSENINTVLFIDKSGIIRYNKEGKLSNEEVTELVNVIKKELSDN